MGVRRLNRGRGRPGLSFRGGSTLEIEIEVPLHDELTPQTTGTFDFSPSPGENALRADKFTQEMHQVNGV